VHKAVRASITGRPGPVFLDLPGDVLTATVESPVEYPRFNFPSKYAPHHNEIEIAVNLISSHKRPLIIVGKGCAYARAEK
jgi:thiamine pyrophosphate-dependent acetolactate synthase large subunit-like protein